jgi:hypothetical protein
MYGWMQDDDVLKKLLERTRKISARQQWLLGKSRQAWAPAGFRVKAPAPSLRRPENNGSSIKRM